MEGYLAHKWGMADKLPAEHPYRTVAPGVRLMNPITGSTRFTSSATVSVAFDPLAGYDLYQVTESATEPVDGWLDLDPGNPPTPSYTFDSPSPDSVLTLHVWVKDLTASRPTRGNWGQITYTITPPIVLAKDITVAVDTTRGRTILPAEVDNGSSDPTGIFSMHVTPSVIYGPTEVTLSVTNMAGVGGSASATISVTYLDFHAATHGDDTTGTGRQDAPYRTIGRALQDAASVSGATVYAGPGLYNPAAGETFPLVVPEGVALQGVRGPVGDASDSTLVDPAGTTNALVLGTLGEDPGNQGPGALRDVIVTDSGGTAIYGRYWNGTIANTLVRAVGAGTFHGNCAALYLEPVRATIVLDGLAVTGIVSSARDLLYVGSGAGSTIVTNSLFSNLKSTAASSVYYFRFDGNATMVDTIIEDIQLAGNGGTGDFSHHGFCLSANTVNRCIFRRLTFDKAYPVLHGSSLVANSLFHDIASPSYRATIGGFRVSPVVRNCTFHNVGTVFRPPPDGTGYTIDVYNSSVSDCRELNDEANTLRKLRLHNVNIHNTPLGEGGYTVAESANVTAHLPWYRDADGKDFRLRTLSPLVDLGDNAYVVAAMGNRDLALDLRAQDGTADGTATVDIGAFESRFLDPPAPRFMTARPTVAGFSGGTLAVPVWIAPPVAGAVTAQVHYAGADLSGPAVLSFADGVATSVLEIAVTASLSVDPGTLLAVRLSESTTGAGVADGELGVYVYDAFVTITNYAPRLFVRSGESAGFRVRLEDEKLAAPMAIAISVTVSGAGSNTIEWEGDAEIPEGGVESAGYLRVVGGSGPNTVQLEVGDGFRFRESGAAALTIEVIGFESPLHVAPGGSDATGLGTAANPLKTLAYAIPWLRPGETVRAAAGLYAPSATGETFPVTLPEGYRLIGARGPRGDETDSAVLDAEGTGRVLVLGTLGNDPGVEGGSLASDLVLQGAAGTAIYGRYWSGTLANTLVRGEVAPGVFLGNCAALYLEPVRATIVLDGLAVTGVVSSAVNLLYIGSGAGSTIVTNSLFSHLATTATSSSFYFNFAGTATLVDTIVEDISLPGNGDTGDFGHHGFCAGANTVNRCIFRRLTFDKAYPVLHGSSLVANSLFHDIASPSYRATIGGFRVSPVVRNCTFHNVGTVYRPPPDGTGNTIDVYNSSVSDCRELNDEANTLRKLRLHNVNIHNTPLGEGGYTVAESVNVTDHAPGYVAPDARNFRLRSVSPLIDAGNNAYVVAGMGLLDLDLNPRFIDGNRDKTATVDLGAYECEPGPAGSLFMMR